MDEGHEPVFAFLVELPVLLDLVEDVVLHVLNLLKQGLIRTRRNLGVIRVGVQCVYLFGQVTDERLEEGFVSLQTLCYEEESQLEIVREFILHL